MRRIGLAAIAASLAVVGCGQAGQDGGAEYSDGAVAVEMIAPARSAEAPTAPAPAEPGASAQTPVAVNAPRIAYVYHYGLEVPVDRAPGLMARHEQACASAGAAVCQVIGSDTTRIGQDDLTARLEIRATPAFITRFRNGLANDAREAGGRVAQTSTESEDLTRSLVDTEARLRAQTTLRDRLQGLLATRSGSLEDLLKVETELARVQGEIDAQQSMLVEMRTRVATSRLSIEYRSAGQLAPDSAFRPVVQAVQGAFAAMMATVGVLITILAILIPIGLIATPIVWFILRRRRAAKSTPPA
ncbi:DUF4349 domain-containing protein [Brevundimonas sp.]|uniref:DUF4349 domain-containing protein n=1 Tax=Brevundimonas sp. TaxID=1871086 RepID=UPI003D0DF494